MHKRHFVKTNMKNVFLLLLFPIYNENPLVNLIEIVQKCFSVFLKNLHKWHLRGFYSTPRR